MKNKVVLLLGIARLCGLLRNCGKHRSTMTRLGYLSLGLVDIFELLAGQAGAGTDWKMDGQLHNFSAGLARHWIDRVRGNPRAVLEM